MQHACIYNGYICSFLISYLVLTKMSYKVDTYYRRGRKQQKKTPNLTSHIHKPPRHIHFCPQLITFFPTTKSFTFSEVFLSIQLTSTFTLYDLFIILSTCSNHFNTLHPILLIYSTHNCISWLKGNLRSGNCDAFFSF